MNIENIKALAEIFNSNGLSKLEICEGETKIYLEKADSSQSRALQVQSERKGEPFVSVSGEILDFNKVTEIKSPMVGVFYAAPSPEADPFVTIGSKIKKGDILCIVEAMKLMNEITAGRDGEIVDICLKNGDIAEFGQVLFKIF